jgi:hypothetical protein
MGGVVPLPHTTIATPKVQARIVDNVSRQPVAGATVRVPERPQITAMSAEDGEIALRRTRNFHWAYLWAGGDKWSEPRGFEWSRQLELTHSNYTPQLLRITLPYSPRLWPSSTNLGEVALERKQ